MKSWFLFGSGLFLGMVFGALTVAFFLYDVEMAAPQLSSRTPVAPGVAKAKGSQPKVSVSVKTHLPPAAAKTQTVGVPRSMMLQSHSDSENRPAAITAEEVNTDSLPSTDHDGVMATARTDTAPDSHSTQ